jgi:small subunit ribosomal protein S16
MLVIRFQRVGKKHQPTFRLVVGERRRKPKGKYLESLGWYNPRTKERKLDAARIQYWVERGARLSETAGNLLKRAKGKEDLAEAAAAAA